MPSLQSALVTTVAFLGNIENKTKITWTQNKIKQKLLEHKQLWYDKPSFDHTLWPAHLP